MNPLLQLAARVAQLEQRLSQMVRHGPVREVNPAEGWVRLDLGDGLLSAKVPYSQMAGALKVHAPPSVGQNMTLIAPTGDPQQAVALPLTWSDQNKAPSIDGAERVLNFGSVTVTITADGIVIDAGATSFAINSGGIQATAADYDFQ